MAASSPARSRSTKRVPRLLRIALHATALGLPLMLVSVSDSGHARAMELAQSEAAEPSPASAAKPETHSPPPSRPGLKTAPPLPAPLKPSPPKTVAQPAKPSSAGGIVAPVVDAAGLSAPQNPEPVLHAARAGLGPCLPAIERGAAAGIDGPHNAFSNWYPGAPNLHAFLSIAAQSYASTVAPRATAILLATPSATGCDSSTIQVFPTARSCADVEHDFLKDGAAVTTIAGLPVFKANAGGHRLLMPTAGNGCVIIAVTVQYVPAAAPPPPSIVTPRPDGSASQPQPASPGK